ncbi:uncharacterized protein PAC_11210 [Phialocephala subalpina]|uniref:non-specific serine/threonine protein kinase n=1 Tax=Phialocephala subalpina TaxID=576137 RepID=A0A1L7X8G8_9HELO|nr:uncharacterized protein PAC_11210 [Phialocephala subalpina]
MSNRDRNQRPPRRLLNPRDSTGIFDRLASLIRENCFLDYSPNTASSLFSGAPPALRRVSADRRRRVQRVRPPRVASQYVFSEEFRAAVLPDAMDVDVADLPAAMDVDVDMKSLPEIWGQPDQEVPQPVQELLEYLQEARQRAQVAQQPVQSDTQMTGILMGPIPSQNVTYTGGLSTASKQNNTKIGRRSTVPALIQYNTTTGALSVGPGSSIQNIQAKIKPVPQFSPTSLNKAMAELVAENNRRFPNANTKNPFWRDLLANFGGLIDVAAIPMNTQKAWLASSKNWKTGLNTLGWVGKKVLGMGNYGIVGLWENEEIKDDDPGKCESWLLELCNQTGTDHIVRQLQAIHYDEGQGTSPWDPKDGDVSRVYLEFCKNGNLSGYIQQLTAFYPADVLIPEATIWRVFECLSRGLCVMAYGNETGEGVPWKEPIGHYDLKPDNILIGSKDEDHVDHEIVKIADFGMAIPIPPGKSADALYEVIGMRGTREYITPEQFEISIPNRAFGTCSNVWQVGKCMYDFAMRGAGFEVNELFEFTLQPQPGQPTIRPFGTWGKKLTVIPDYSIVLRDFIPWCLAGDPSLRPTPKKMLEICTMALAIADTVVQNTIVPLGATSTTLVLHDEPEDLSMGSQESSQTVLSSDDKTNCQGPPQENAPRNPNPYVASNIFGP